MSSSLAALRGARSVAAKFAAGSSCSSSSLEATSGARGALRRRWLSDNFRRSPRGRFAPTPMPKEESYESEAMKMVHQAETGKLPPPEEPGEDADHQAWADYFNEKFIYDMDNYEPPQNVDPENPLAHIDMDAYMESVKPDYETKPEGLENVKLEYEFNIYPPYLSLFLESKLQPNQKVKVTLQVADLELTPAQTEYMIKLVGNRYKPSKGTLSFVSRRADSVKENMEIVKKLLSDVVANIRAH